MDTTIHFSEVLGLLVVLGGAGAWVWALASLIQRRFAHRRARALFAQYYRS